MVKAGDTLSSISRRGRLSVGAIIDANQLSSNVIKPGQVLKLPHVRSLGVDPLRQSKKKAEELPVYHPGSYRLIRRRDWKAPAMRRNQRAMNGVKRITVHHTGSHRGFIGKSDREIVQMIERYHRNERKWATIGYHYLVGHDGAVYEGRPANIQGAHVARNNSNNLGIAMIGDFNKKAPTAKQLSTLHGLLREQQRKYRVKNNKIYGHKDLGKTVCPGKFLYNWLQDYKRKANRPKRNQEAARQSPASTTG